MKSFDKLFNTAYDSAQSIKKNVYYVSEDSSIIKEVIIDVMTFMNSIDLFYKNYIHKKKFKEVSVSNIVFEIKALKGKKDQEFWIAYKKLKRLRNAIVHSVIVCSSIPNYFHKDITRVEKIAKRLDQILNTVEEDLNYL